MLQKSALSITNLQKITFYNGGWGMTPNVAIFRGLITIAPGVYTTLPVLRIFTFVLPQ
jgi:hypothetical protein